jgi:subtilisin-like proprotein convertase family protein
MLKFFRFLIQGGTMKLVYFISSLLLMCAFSMAVSAQTTFTNSTQINIPDGIANPYPSTINVTGLTGTITDINVRINGFSHTFPDDVAMLLVSPDGKKFILQSDVGGGADVTGVTYTFDDQATAVIGDTGPFPANNTSVKPSSAEAFPGDDDELPSPAPAPPYNQPAPTGSATLNGTFGGINPNGTWQLFVIDFFQDDQGSISGGWSLIITTSGGGGVPRDAPVDFNGDGKTDYAVVRDVTGTSGVPAGQMRWFYNINGSNAPTVALDWGLTFDDIPVPEDYDGDGKDDIAVWRPGAPNVAAFYILNSATNTARVEAFGQTDDDPTVVGDYTGDGKADLAVYREGTTTGAQSFWFYRAAANGPTTFIPWGAGGDFPAPGDYDGDGKNDFVIQRSIGAGQSATFWTRLATGVILPVQSFGLPSDFVVPGDYDGDGKTDLATIRIGSGALNWYWRRSSDQLLVGPVPFGVATANSSDFPVPGDYDGDGRTDVAVWRPSNGEFSSRSTGTKAITFFKLGASTDYPVAFYNVH